MMKDVSANLALRQVTTHTIEGNPLAHEELPNLFAIPKCTSDTTIMCPHLPCRSKVCKGSSEYGSSTLCYA